MKKLTPKTLFNGSCEFILGAHNFSQSPQHRYPEIAFLGASNVGKSSLTNALVGKKIAIVSTTPGRTRQLNFFNIAETFVLVDMPGYGYAKANPKHIEQWQKTSFEYLTKRPNLKRVFLLIDPIKGLKEADREAINVFNMAAVSFQIVLTKSDKLAKEDVEKMREKIQRESQKWPAAHPEIIVTSSTKDRGIYELQDAIVEILNLS